jgi:hypothetical protein
LMLPCFSIFLGLSDGWLTFLLGLSDGWVIVLLVFTLLLSEDSLSYYSFVLCLDNWLLVVEEWICLTKLLLWHQDAL